jgi:2-C-methyl-D-erythritol 4-phosphate cytidylyltransferase
MPSETAHPTCAAIIVAAGASHRMGMDKLTWPLDGLPVLQHTLNAFLSAGSISSVILVCQVERWNLLETTTSPKPVIRIDGGSERQDSVLAGLAALHPTDRFVAVHDGARPLVSTEDIDRCVAAAITHRAATLARRATETMQRGDEHQFSTEAVSRENLWCMETPQVFEVPLLLEAYQHIATCRLSVTDEVSAVQAIGVRTKFIESSHPNLKITSPADLLLAEALVKRNS